MALDALTEPLLSISSQIHAQQPPWERRMHIAWQQAGEEAMQLAETAHESWEASRTRRNNALRKRFPLLLAHLRHIGTGPMEIMPFRELVRPADAFGL